MPVAAAVGTKLGTTSDSLKKLIQGKAIYIVEVFTELAVEEARAAHIQLRYNVSERIVYDIVADYYGQSIVEFRLFIERRFDRGQDEKRKLRKKHRSRDRIRQDHEKAACKA